MIAEVIVDVAAYPIDRPFDYIVPEPLRSIIEPGARVKVPFGPQKSHWLYNKVERRK